jgi:formate/nitrite transporter FocA (FNT family)
MRSELSLVVACRQGLWMRHFQIYWLICKICETDLMRNSMLAVIAELRKKAAHTHALYNWVPIVFTDNLNAGCTLPCIVFENGILCTTMIMAAVMPKAG